MCTGSEVMSESIANYCSSVLYIFKGVSAKISSGGRHLHLRVLLMEQLLVDHELWV